MALHICSAAWFIQCVLVVTFHDFCLSQLLSQPARELMFLLNLVEYMVVLLAVMFSPRNVSVSVLYASPFGFANIVHAVLMHPFSL